MIYIKFKYNLIKELKMAQMLLRSPEHFRNLRLVSWPNARTFWRIVTSGGLIRYFKRSEFEISNFLSEKLAKIGSKLQGDFTCYLHFIGPEGRYNPERREIQANCSFGFVNFLETLWHELLHLEYYNPELSEDENEVIVGKIEEKYPFEP
ncbi:hypothetical protein KKB83_05565 [Patescibacteria group bacterium]|nr:hypothetical protein [Patescibacteria group bacterium]